MGRRKRSNGGLYRRGLVLAFRYKDPETGCWKEKCTGERDRSAAKKVRDEFLTDLQQGTLPTEMADWRLSEAEQWWKEYRKLRTSENTQNSERYRLQHLRLVLGDKRLSEIKNVDIENYVTARLAAEIGAHSINKEVRLWSMILKKAKLWRKLADDYKQLKTTPSAIGQAITRDQLRHLTEVASQDEDWEAAFYGSAIAANTGLRAGEIRKLKIRDVDLEHKQLSITAAKTDAGVRTVEMNQDAAEAAARLLLRASKLKPPATEKDHYLMPKHLSRISHGQHKGQRGYDPSQHQTCWDTAWASLTEKAGLVGLRFHDLRHSFITHMIERGVALGLIEGMVGHVSKRMTLHYAHVTSGAARKAVEALDAEAILTPTLTAEKRSEKKVYRV